MRQLGYVVHIRNLLKNEAHRLGLKFVPCTNPTCFKTEPGTCGRTFKFQPSLRKKKYGLSLPSSLEDMRWEGWQRINLLPRLVLLKLLAHQYKCFNLSNNIFFHFFKWSSDVTTMAFDMSAIERTCSRFSAAGAQSSTLMSNKRWALHLLLTLNTDFLCQLGSSCLHGSYPQFHDVPTHKFHGYEQTSKIHAEKNTTFTSEWRKQCIRISIHCSSWINDSLGASLRKQPSFFAPGPSGVQAIYKLALLPCNRKKNITNCESKQISTERSKRKE